MKIIDKTPFQNADGEVNLFGRAQGTLKYGPSWYPELQAQKTVIAQLDRLLEKGFVLIRNFNLPGSEVIVPLILMGPNGVSVIYVTHLKGFYEAKGEQWNRVDQGRSLAAPRNLLTIADRLARATQKYIDIQKLNIPGQVEPVLMAADPGLNIETMRPITKVVKSDAIKQYASSLIQGRPMLRNEQVYELAERLVTPPVAEEAPAPAAPTEAAPPPSRAKALFNASQGSAPAFGSDTDLGFAFNEDGDNVAPQFLNAESAPARELAQAPVISQQKRVLGMKPSQIALLVGMFVVECCIVIGGGAYLFYFAK